VPKDEDDIKAEKEFSKSKRKADPKASSTANGAPKAKRQKGQTSLYGFFKK
jgi:hypothetical protein